MKKLILILLFFSNINNMINAQVKNFKTAEFNKKMFLKINQFRKQNSLDTFIYSKTCEKFISKVNVETMEKEKRVFHPKVDKESKLLRDSLGQEWARFEKIKNFKPYHTFISYSEISAGGGFLINTSIDDLVNDCFNGWLNSPRHKEILLKESFFVKTMWCSIYVKIVNGNTFYTTVDFLEVESSNKETWEEEKK